jgi:hypothetical protein
MQLSEGETQERKTAPCAEMGLDGIPFVGKR